MSVANNLTMAQPSEDFASAAICMNELGGYVGMENSCGFFGGTFPLRLHIMLDDAPRKDFEHIVSWQFDGKGFRVHKVKEFVENVLTKYFNQTRYKSFQRQLNMYGFQRVTSGPGKGSYTHQYFVHGVPALCGRMVRIKIKSKHQQQEKLQVEEQQKDYDDDLEPLPLSTILEASTNAGATTTILSEASDTTSSCEKTICFGDQQLLFGGSAFSDTFFPAPIAAAVCTNSCNTRRSISNKNQQHQQEESIVPPSFLQVVSWPHQHHGDNTAATIVSLRDHKKRLYHDLCNSNYHPCPHLELLLQQERDNGQEQEEQGRKAAATRSSTKNFVFNDDHFGDDSIMPRSYDFLKENHENISLEFVDDIINLFNEEDNKKEGESFCWSC